MVEKFEIGIVILGYVIRNTILGESLINWIDQLYGTPRPPVFDLDTVVREKIHKIINKYHLIGLQNINIDLQNLSNLLPMFNSIMNERLTNPAREDLIFINYIFGLDAQQTIDRLRTTFPHVDFHTSFRTPENETAIRQDIELLPSPQAKIDEIHLLMKVNTPENYLGLQRRARVVPAYQTALREVFDASHTPIKFTQRKFLNVSLSDLLTSRTNFTHVVKNFATGLYNFFKGYMSTPSVVETPLDTTSLNGNNVQNRRVLGVN
jgi:hypothetical protein